MFLGYEKKKNWILLMLLSTLFIIISCGGGGDNSSDDEEDNLADLVSLDIADAKSVFIGSGPSALNSSSIDSVSKSSGNQAGISLWKILEDNTIHKVNTLGKNKNKISLHYWNWDLIPVIISPVNDNFFVIGFMDESTYQCNILNIQQGLTYPQFAFLVRKSDGAVFRLKTLPDTNIFVYTYDPSEKRFFKTDSLGNMYYIGHDEFLDGRRYIVKVNLFSFSSTIITPYTHDIERFEVDSSGNIIYAGHKTGEIDTIARIRSANGAYMVLPCDHLRMLWKAPDDSIYFVKDDEYDIKLFNQNTFEIATYGSLPGYIWYGRIFNFKGCTYIIYDSGLAEVYNSTAIPRNIPFIGVSAPITINNYCLTEDYLYILGKDSSHNDILIKVNPATGECTQILGNEYEIYSFSVSEQDGIIFNALRMADGKRIIGKVSTSGGAVTVLDQESNAQITYLERIR